MASASKLQQLLHQELGGLVVNTIGMGGQCTLGFPCCCPVELLQQHRRAQRKHLSICETFFFFLSFFQQSSRTTFSCTEENRGVCWWGKRQLQHSYLFWADRRWCRSTTAWGCSKRSTQVAFSRVGLQARSDAIHLATSLACTCSVMQPRK